MILFRGREGEVLVYYLLAVLLGIGIGIWAVSNHVVALEGGEETSTAGYIFLWVIAATAVFLALLHLFPWLVRIVVRLFELFALFVTTSLLFSALFNDLAGISWGMTLALARILFGERFRNLSVSVIGGISAGIIGASLHPAVALLLYVLLILYDFVSVFITKHMVELAKGLEKGIGKGEAVALGGGDLVVPLLFAASFLRYSPVASFTSSAGAVLGTLLAFYCLKKLKHPLPALPYIGAVQLTLTALSLFLSTLLL